MEEKMKKSNRKHKRKLPRVPLIFTVLKELDANGNAIIVIRNIRFYYVDVGKRKGEGADHLWVSERGARLLFQGPDYKYAYFAPEPITKARRTTL
jgi:hypothetical protein